MSHRVMITMILLVSVAHVQAITWDFEEDDNAQGWNAELGNGSGPLLRSEVRDGVWRVHPTPYDGRTNPAIQLISPLIGHDSSLFDRVAIRFRLIHTEPIESGLGMRWTNSTNSSSPGFDFAALLDDDIAHYRMGISAGRVTYTTDWQEVVISDLRTKLVERLWGDPYEILWEGELIDIRIGMGLTPASDTGPYRIQGPEEVPEAVEIDWIVLTGVEEQLQGELPPPPAAANPSLGATLSPPVLHPLGVPGVRSPPNNRAAALGDLDGDGDLDLVTPWGFSRGEEGYEEGRLRVFNDGTGRFEHPEIEMIAAATYLWGFLLRGVDVDGDERMDLFLPTPENDTRLLLNDEEQGFVLAREFGGLRLVEAGDADGDGDVDLWMRQNDPRDTGLLPVDQLERPRDDHRLLLLNDGAGSFGPPILFEPPGEGFLAGNGVYTGGLVQHLGQGEVTGMLWNPLLITTGETFLRFADPVLQRSDVGYVVDHLTAAGVIGHEALQVSTHPYNIRYAGDFDWDGDTDLIVSDEFTMGTPGQHYLYHGLTFLANRGDGTMDTLLTLPDMELNHAVHVTDVNGDGRLDAVAVHSSLRDPAVVLLLGEGGGGFVVEGRYPLEGGRGGAMVSGDLDGDGDVDLVVLETATYDNRGGIFVLLNRSADEVTAVEEDEEEEEEEEEEMSAAPSHHQLGVPYPNPFNPGVVIPFELGEREEVVSLMICNVLGQVVRRMELGVLPAGAHQAVWDGENEEGQELSSGLYLYRLQAGRWRATGKMVKSE